MNEYSLYKENEKNCKFNTFKKLNYCNKNMYKNIILNQKANMNYK